MSSPPELPTRAADPSLQFIVWDARAGQTFASLEGLENVPEVFELKRGFARAKGFPEKATFRMNARFPKKVQLADCAVNFEKVVVASKRVREILESKQAPDVEYLPVTILDHKGRVASADHVIVNPLQVIDCIDQARSTLTWNKIDPEYIAFLEGLVFKPGAIPPSSVVVRAKHLAATVFLRKDVADEIEAQGLTGAQFLPLDELEI
jgi:hypothetical protein